jgi:hypothetical protein
MNSDSKEGAPFAGTPHRESSEWNGIHDSTPCPQVVQPALKHKRRFRTHVAIKDFAIVAHLLDDIVCPLFIETESLTIAWGDSQETLDLGIRAL